jgi:bifunctional DNase/RNase
MIQEAGGETSHIAVTDLSEDTFYARIVMKLKGRSVELDSRPSDAIALAVRLQVPIYVARHVMDKASTRPSAESPKPEEEEKLDAFHDLLEDLDLNGLGKGKAPKED